MASNRLLISSWFPLGSFSALILRGPAIDRFYYLTMAQPRYEVRNNDMWHVECRMLATDWPNDSPLSIRIIWKKIRIVWKKKNEKFRNHVVIRVRFEVTKSAQKKNETMRKWENGKVKTLKSHKSIRLWMESISSRSIHALNRTRQEWQKKNGKIASVFTFDSPFARAHTKFGPRLSFSTCVWQYFPLVSDSIEWNFKFEMDTTCERMCFDSALDSHLYI